MALTLDGDIIIEDGDVVLASGTEWYALEVNKRLRSGADWYHHPALGADVLQFAGHMNTRETGQLIKDTVRASLGRDAQYLPASIQVEVVPTSIDSVNLLVIAEQTGERATVNHTVIDFNRGVLQPLPNLTQKDKRPEPATPYKEPTNKYQLRRR